MHGDGFEKQRLAIHVDVHGDDFPARSFNLPLLHEKCAAFFQTTQDTPTEGDILEKMPIDLHQPLLTSINRQGAFHFFINGSLTVGWIEVRIGVEVEAD